MAEKFINDKTPVYFTYARNDKSVRGWEHIADIVPDLLKTFRHEKVKYSVDVEDIRNGEKISDYEKEIGNAEYVIIILSDRYFYRYHCMFELFNILKNKDGKTIKYIKSGSFNIDDNKYKAKIKEFWRQEKAKIDNRIAEFRNPNISELEQAAIDNNFYLDFIDKLSALFRSVSYTKAEDIRLGVLGPNVQHTKFVTEIKKDLGWTPPTVQPKPTSNDKNLLYALIALVAVLFVLVILLWVKMPSGNDSTVTGTQTEETKPIEPQPEKKDGNNAAQSLTIPIIIDGKEYGKMILVKGGTFQMGATDGQDDEKPVHTVTLSDYYIGETEVTQGLWEAVMGDNPSNTARGIGDNYPVNNVSWNGTQDFIKKLNAKTGRKFCLPTEAQWEFAARGGNESQGYQYSGSDTIDDVAWYWDNSNGQTYPVKQKKANELGIYDMSGNVWEWCQDLFGDYPNGAVTNPQGPSSGSSRVLRGGSWRNGAFNCRVSYRDSSRPGYRDHYFGMRLALPCSPFPS